MYLGPGFSYRTSNGTYLVLFQVGAKIMEIICVASLTTIVLHVLRHDLLRDGVPLGFVGSGVFFSQANCFWSPEMFAGAMYSIQSWKKLRLLLLVLVAGALALLIAPSSAVLLQPRFQNVPAGGTAYFLPVALDQLWPREVDGSDELQECFGEYVAQNVVCPSAGFESLRNYFLNFNTSFAVIDSMMWDTYGLQPLVAQSLALVIPRLVNTIGVGGFNRETFTSQPNMISAIFQDALTKDWRLSANVWSGSRLSAKREYRYADQRISSVVTTNPVVLPRCSPAQNVSVGPSHVMFPVKRWTNRKIDPSDHGSTQWEDDDRPYNVDISSHNVSSSLRYEWINLPVDQFGPVSGGVSLYLPRNASDTTQAVIGCTISAFWFSGEMTSDSLTHEAAWSLTESNKQWAPIRTDLNASSAEAIQSRRLIAIRKDWFRSLTPLTFCSSLTNQSQQVTTLECLFSDVGLLTILDDMRTQSQLQYIGETCVQQPPNSSETDVHRWNNDVCGNGGKHQLLELVLGTILADGLSRYGSRHAFDQSSMNDSRDPFRWELKSLPKAPDYYTSLLSDRPRHSAILPAPADSDQVNLHMRVEVAGYAWYASSFSDYLAITVVLIYMLIALVHTVWVLVTGVTSTSWDTVTELLALALGSPVSNALNGSGAGIERLKTYRRMLKLRVKREGGNDRLVLLVDDEENVMNDRTNSSEGPEARYTTVDVDTEYL